MGIRHHLLIAGTGRAGTSALVQYLNGLGLETHLSRPGGSADWHDSAQAGFEDLPLYTNGHDLPYVIKSPLTYQIIDQILKHAKISLDAVLIPIRPLVEAAASRSIVQLQAMHQDAGWMAEVATPWEHLAAAPGGAIFSVSPIDQARLLAVGFHWLLERIVQTDVPVVLLSFPRLVSDPDYLFAKIGNVLPIEVPIARAREVHAETFNPEKVRAGRELSDNAGPAPELNGFTGSSITALDNMALKRELKQLREELESLRQPKLQRVTARARKIAGRLRRDLLGRRASSSDRA
jgi:hypothetical protein